MRYTRLFPLSLLLIAALLPTQGAVAASPNRPEIGQDSMRIARPLDVKIETASWYAPEDALNINFTLTNTNAYPVWVLRWQLPQGRLDANLFHVTKDGQEVAYQGRLVKRAAPKAKDYIEIKSGESYTVTLDPSAFYEMEGQGTYGIQFRPTELSLRVQVPDSIDQAHPSMLLNPALAKAQAQEVLPTHEAAVSQGATGQFYFAGVPADTAEKTLESNAPQSIVGGYTGCTTTQKSKLVTAHANAKTMSSKATANLTNYPSGSTLYKTWFGTYSSSRFSTVKNHYAAISNVYANKSVTFDCSCTDDYYAYVYPSQPYKIYLCNAFWSAPATGRDSQAGTLVHETSHFTAVAGTQDYVYGATGAKKLATTNPAKAIMNADNHEYFGEDQ